MPFDESMIPPDAVLEEMAALEPLVMVGYPIGIWDDKHNMPIFRKGVAATHPYLDHRGEREFFIDMACFPGSGGSPVLFVRNGIYSDKYGRNIVGHAVMLLGILWSGPQYSIEGKIEVVPVPTQLTPIPVSRIPTNLGYVIKAKRLLEILPELRRRVTPDPFSVQPSYPPPTRFLVSVAPSHDDCYLTWVICLYSRPSPAATPTSRGPRTGGGRSRPPTG